MNPKDFIGKRVEFLPGPRSTSKVQAKVTGHEKKGNFDYLVTSDDTGKERRVSPSKCKVVG